MEKVVHNVGVPENELIEKSNRMKLNEGESEEKSAANEWQGRRWIRAQQSTAMAGGTIKTELKQKMGKYRRIKVPVVYILISPCVSICFHMTPGNEWLKAKKHFVQSSTLQLRLAVRDQFLELAWLQHTQWKMTPNEMPYIMPLFYCVIKKYINWLMGIQFPSVLGWIKQYIDYRT